MGRYQEHGEGRPVKHRTKSLTLYTGRIVRFGPKAILDKLADRLRAKGIECKIGRGRASSYLLVRKQDVARATIGQQEEKML